MVKKKRILSVFGTRPEAIKMAPVVHALAQSDVFESVVCVTGQHREMLDQVLAIFEIEPDVDLEIMVPNQALGDITATILTKMPAVFDAFQPDVVLVHGDTTTTLAVSLAAFYAKIPVGHVEAGLRTFDMRYPFPEELNRVVADTIATYHFAPTQQAVDNLSKMGIESQVVMTGNTVIDALLHTVNTVSPDLSEIGVDEALKTIVVTVHRRENFGQPIRDICGAIRQIVRDNADVQVVFPVHPNPNVHDVVMAELSSEDRVQLAAPLDYAMFASLLNRATLILTDSGGIQEEAPALGKPVLVLRDVTERPEAVVVGTVMLVGSDCEQIVANAQRLLDDEGLYQKMATASNPYGDGQASKRIVAVLGSVF